MKVRKNFVSNSSSSSFVVAFPKKPSTEQELRDMMFTDEEYIAPYADTAASVEDICEIVFREIQDQGQSASAGMIAAEFYGEDDERAQEFADKHKDGFVLCTEYEDHTRLGGVMEHGDIFRNLDHIRVSNH